MTKRRVAVDIKTATEITGLHRETLRRYIARGKLPAHRLGPKLIRVYVDDLDRLMNPVGAA